MIKEQTMHPNPVLRKLGWADDDRAVIIHTDDIGMCQASLAAFADLVEFGLISSGATMVPCPWFPQVAAYCRAHPRDSIASNRARNFFRRIAKLPVLDDRAHRRARPSDDGFTAQDIFHSRELTCFVFSSTL